MSVQTGICLGIDAVFGVYMFWAASKVKKTAKRQSYWDRAVHVAMLIVSFTTPFIRWGDLPLVGFQLVPNDTAASWTGVGVCAAGMGFCFWARYTLGANWSAIVTVKKDHELIQKGPYLLTRHPMYTGILTGFFGVALTTGAVGNFFGPALLLFAFLRKMKLEETYMTQHFGKRYIAYTQKVKRLVPFIY
jgi:protein-S-isoprenylcysteine O-methyltransferase Ste14